MGAKEKTFVYPSTEREYEPFVTSPAALETHRERIVADIRARVNNAGATGVVVAMSGGIDSTVTAALAVEAVGSDRVLALGLPCHKADRTHVNEARTIAEGLGIEFHERQLQPLLTAFEETFAADFDPAPTSRPNERNQAIGNVIARLRMVCTYYAANRRSRLVLGTANRSELLLGYFTKYGDGAADTYPIGDLYKTEVRALATRLGIPRRIIGKEPTAGFWADQTDATELGATYDVIDPLLRRLVDEGDSVEEAIATLDIDPDTACDLASLFAETAHKRTTPRTPGLPDRDGFSDSESARLS
jgi:NAD+ synthase